MDTFFFNEEPWLWVPREREDDPLRELASTSHRRRNPVTADIDLQLVCRRKISQTQPSRRHSGPSLAGMGERAYFPIAEEPRYLGNRQFPFPQIAFGKNFPQLLQHLRE